MISLLNLHDRLVLLILVLLLTISVISYHHQQQTFAFFHESLFKSNNGTYTSLNRTTATTTEEIGLNMTTNLSSQFQLDDKKKISSKSNQSSLLSVDIGIAEDPITTGSIQTITVIVTDQSSNTKVVGAQVEGKVKYVTSTTKDFSGITDDQGMISYSWKIGSNSKPGTFTVDVKASANGYESLTKTKMFEVS